MRFLHLSDLHLGKRVCEFSMLDDQRYILEQILSLLDSRPVDAVLLAGDQILKYWVVTHLAVGESAPFLPGFMQLTRLHNYGAAWSSFSGRTVLLVVFTAVLLAVVALLLLKKVVRHWTGVTACTLILSGGIGNIIDRIVHGYVVDMFDLQLFSYPVFNLADCCVVVGAILGGIYYLFLYEKYDKKKKESDHAHDPSDPS